MCLILDANKFSDYINPDDLDMEPVRKWIRTGNGKIAYAPTEKLRKELEKHDKMRTQFDLYRESGRMRLYIASEVEQAKDSLPDLQSDDPDIIALALVSGVRLLISGDRKLHTDFKQIVRGKIYQNRNHSNLLKQDTCPS